MSDAGEASSPEAPSSVEVVATESGVSLSWTVPEGDLVRVIVARYPSGSSPTQPTDGTTYAVGDALGVGVVVYVGELEMFADSVPECGTYSYAVHVLDSLSRYSAPTVVEATGAGGSLWYEDSDDDGYRKSGQHGAGL